MLEAADQMTLRVRRPYAHQAAAQAADGKASAPFVGIVRERRQAVESWCHLHAQYSGSGRGSLACSGLRSQNPRLARR